MKHKRDQRIKMVLLFLQYVHQVSRNRENMMIMLPATDRETDPQIHLHKANRTLEREVLPRIFRGLF